MGFESVVFREDGGERDLGNDVFIEFVLEERSGGEVEGEHEVTGCVDEDFGGFFEAEAVASVGFGGDLLAFDFQFALEYAMDDAGAGFCFTSA